MNGTLKETLTKFKLETSENWVSLFPFALLRVRGTLYLQGITPYEIMFKRLLPLLPNIGIEKVTEIHNFSLLKSLQALHLARKETQHLVSATQGSPGQPLKPHSHSPGDWIWVKKIQPAALEPRWDGPFPVILTTPTAVKVTGCHHWIHHTRIETAQPPKETEQWTICQTRDPLKIRLSRAHSGPS